MSDNQKQKNPNDPKSGQDQTKPNDPSRQNDRKDPSRQREEKGDLGEGNIGQK